MLHRWRNFLVKASVRARAEAATKMSIVTVEVALRIGLVIPLMQVASCSVMVVVKGTDMAMKTTMTTRPLVG
jgi:hypothetical protein